MKNKRGKRKVVTAAKVQQEMFLKKSATGNPPPFFRKETQLTKTQQIGHLYIGRITLKSAPLSGTPFA
ncbi:hypothetical protein QFZ51_004283 [Chitinophaga sp. W3I9]